MNLCATCGDKTLISTSEVKVCAADCGRSTDEDPDTLMYCTECAKKLNVCQNCGQKKL